MPKRHWGPGHSPGAIGILGRVSEEKVTRRGGPARPPNPKQLAARALRRDKPAEPETEESEPTASGPTIRRATSKDLAAVLALRALMFTAMGTDAEKVADGEWQANALRWLQVSLNSPSMYIAVADVNGSTVACAIGEVLDRGPTPSNPSGRFGMLTNVATFPQYRMTGLGQGCVDAVMAWFRDETEVGQVSLNATPEGLRRYLPHGFAEVTFPEMRATLDRAVR